MRRDRYFTFCNLLKISPFLPFFKFIKKLLFRFKNVLNDSLKNVRSNYIGVLKIKSMNNFAKN